MNEQRPALIELKKQLLERQKDKINITDVVKELNLNA
jgi:hypothetical protein